MTPTARAERWRRLDPELPENAPALFEDLLDELERWNRKIKLTAPAPRPELARRIVDDTLLLAPFVKGPTVVDVGTGPGVPALPLSIARPALEIRSVEAIAKKVAFTRSFVARHPALQVKPFTGRAEGRPGEPWAPAVTAVSRAFTAPTEWIRIAAPLVAPGGRIVVTLGAGTGEEADEVARTLGFEPAGSWTGSVGEVRRALRWYDRVG